MLQYSSLNDAWGHNTGTKSKPEQFSQLPKPEHQPEQFSQMQPLPQPEQFSQMQQLESFTCGQHIKTFEFFGIKVIITKDMLTIILILLIIAIFIQLLYLINDFSSARQEKYYVITSTELNKIITSILLDKSLNVMKFNQMSSNLI